MQGKKIGVCITGSFCTFSQVLPVLERLARENQVTAISHDALSAVKLSIKLSPDQSFPWFF